MLLDRLRAELAPRCGYGDVAQALRARLCRRWRCLLRLELCQQILRWKYEEKVDHRGEDQEVDNGRDEVAVHDLAAIDVGDEITVVRLTDSCPQQWLDDVVRESGDDCGESSANDHGDCQVHHIAAQDKVTKTLEHFDLRLFHVPGVHGPTSVPTSDLHAS